MKEERFGIEYWRLAGVISEGIAEYQLFYASIADCLNADGTISSRS